MISTWIICPIGWIIVANLPNTYESEARVYADTQSILGPLLKGLTVSTNPDDQIRLMIKTLLSRPNLERITRMSDLDVQANTPKEYEELINDLKEDIIIKKTGGRRENLFTISFTHNKPETARTVVQSALTVFIENTLGENRTDSDSAQKFLDSQITEYVNRLAKDEARLTDFKQKYSDVLPDQYGGYYNKLNIVKEQLKAVELGLLETKTQLKSAKAQLEAEQLNSTVEDNKIKNSSSIQTTYDERIAELESNLDSLQLRYTEKHPAVKEIKRRLAHLNELRSNEIKKYLGASKNGDSTSYANSLNPVTQQLQIQVNQLENQVASQTVRANQYKKEVKELESKIHVLPEIEAELVALNRGYDITKKKYEELLNRKETAKLGQNADETTNSIQFKVIDPPRVPTEPKGPKRILLFIVVLVLGVGVGVGLSLLTSQINPVVTSANQLSRVTGIPIFGSISANENLGLHRWNRKKSLIFITSNVLLVGLMIMFIAYFLFPDAIQAPIKRILN
jgi:polysaccharide chain length determinant protein (PEP-CTERM system associated)